MGLEVALYPSFIIFLHVQSVSEIFTQLGGRFLSQIKVTNLYNRMSGDPSKLPRCNVFSHVLFLIYIGTSLQELPRCNFLVIIFHLAIFHLNRDIFGRNFLVLISLIIYYFSLLSRYLQQELLRCNLLSHSLFSI